jgi:Protein of unknown function (DUF2442)
MAWSAKVWLGNMELAYSQGYSAKETAEFLDKIAETMPTGWRSGMTSLEFETEGMRPVAVSCDSQLVSMALADGRQIRAPLWWYPYLDHTTPEQRSTIELEFSGVWWPEIDEGVSVKALLLGWKALGAKAPEKAA